MSPTPTAIASSPLIPTKVVPTAFAANVFYLYKKSIPPIRQGYFTNLRRSIHRRGIGNERSGFGLLLYKPFLNLQVYLHKKIPNRSRKGIYYVGFGGVIRKKAGGISN